MKTKMEFVRIECVYKARTNSAVLVAIDDNEVWVPRSNISFRSDEAVDAATRGQEIELQVVDWFAKKEGLV